jgi:hypothetical protein
MGAKGAGIKKIELFGNGTRLMFELGNKSGGLSNPPLPNPYISPPDPLKKGEQAKKCGWKEFYGVYSGLGKNDQNGSFHIRRTGVLVC